MKKNNYKEYKINESDIDKVINYLKIVDPENAAPDNAIAFLEYYAKRFHEMGHVLKDEELKNLYEKFKDNKLDS